MKRSILCFFWALIFVAIGAFKVQGQHNYERFIDSLMIGETGNNTPGFAIALMKGDSILLKKGYGLSNLEHRIPFSSETVSDIGSVSKHFTSYCILLCEQMGLLNINDPIHKYLPDLNEFEHPITIKHLIHHQSGLREIYTSMSTFGLRSGDGIYQEDVYLLLKDMKELNSIPGEKYNYCNTAYMLLAEIVSKVNSGSFENFISKHVFKPLEMNHSFIMDKPGEIFDNMADSYSGNSESGYTKSFDHSSIQGAGGIYTSLSDLIKWYKHLIFGDGRKYFDRMKEVGILNSGEKTNYGFALTISEVWGHKFIGHNGASAGFRALFSYSPTLDFGIIMKANSPGINLGEIREAMLKSLGVKVIQTKREMEEVDFLPVDDKTAHPLVGTYYSPELSGIQKIRWEDGQLTMSTLRSSIVLGKLDSNVYGTKSNRSFRLNFERDEQGTIIGLRMDSGRSLKQWYQKIK